MLERVMIILGIKRNLIRRAALVVAATLLPLIMLLAASPTPAAAQQIVAMVNGEPITVLDIEQRTKLIVLSTRKTPSHKEVLEELINEKVKILEAKKFTLNITDKDVDSAYENMASRMHLSPDQLNRTLASKGIRPDTLKSRLRAELTWSQLVRGRFQQSFQVTEQDVRKAVGGSEGATNGFEYHLLPIILVVPRGAPSAAFAARKKEADALRSHIQGCDQADRYFRAARAAAVRSKIIKTSADLPKPLREILDKLEIGRMTAPEITRQGIEMFALCERKPSTGDTPAQRAAREKIFTERFAAKSASYLQDARKTMLIEYKR